MGKKEFGRVNLKHKRNIYFALLLFALRRLIYVEQGKGKAAQSDQAYVFYL
jgi:hypothetical protein